MYIIIHAGWVVFVRLWVKKELRVWVEEGVGVGEGVRGCEYMWYVVVHGHDVWLRLRHHEGIGWRVTPLLWPKGLESHTMRHHQRPIRTY